MAAGLQWQTIPVSLGLGLETKQDVRASTGSMDIARDVQFDELMGAQTRHPFAAMSDAIVGGGTLTNCRRLEVVNGELVLMTSDTLYSWSAQLSAWVPRGTHLAVAITETPVFATTGDQINCDRAELAGTVVYAWAEGARVFVAAMDKTTSAVLMSPTPITAASGQARLVALSTRILLFVESTTFGHLIAFAIDPASPAAGLGGAGTTVTAGGIAGLAYDVVRVDSQDQAVGAARSATSTYIAFTVTAGLVVATSGKARTCDGQIAVSCAPGGALTQVARSSFPDVVGDALTTSTLADSATNQAIATTTGGITYLTACHRSVQTGGAFRCYVFWSHEQPAATNGYSGVNWVDTAGAIGTAISFVSQLGLASRAFDRNGSVYVWLAFGALSIWNNAGSFFSNLEALESTYFLYRDDAFLCAKAVSGRGGGFVAGNGISGMLPGVAQTGAATYAWCATQRRSFDAGGVGHTAFAARSPVDVVFAFDSNEARRAAQLGSTLYIAGGEVLQYDGVQLVECGFHVFPWLFQGANAAGGGLAAGSYAFKETFRYENATGETERSSTATIINITVSSNAVTFGEICALTVTHKTSSPPAVELWRTTVNPGVESPFFRVTSVDPAATAGSNRYLVNDPVAGDVAPFTDALGDSTIASLEANPENEGALEDLAPPGAQIIIATDTRLFLARVSGDPHRVWPSKLRSDGSVAAFNDALPIPVPPAGGDITALAFLNETLVVFRETAIYALPGVGFDNNGGGQNFGPANRLASDVGAISAESVVLTPKGLVFKSRKGWYLLDRGWNAQYIGGAVKAFDSDVVNAVHVVETLHQVRVLTNARLLVWDYLNVVDSQPTGMWSEWTIPNGVHATIWDGTYVYLTASGPMIEQSSFAGVTYGADVEISWLKTADLQGAIRVRAIGVLGEFRSDCLLRIRVARDYQYDAGGNPVYFDDIAWEPSPGVVGSALQVRHQLSQQQLESLKVRITAVTDAQRAMLSALDLSPQVATSGAPWSARWLALAPGEMGNELSMSFAFEDGAPFSIDVRDHFTWNAAAQRWSEAIGNVGVRVLCRAGSSPTVAQLEAAIAPGLGGASQLVNLNAADFTPTKIVDAVAMANVMTSGDLTGGAYGAPSGEAVKLTGLSLEVGIKPGLYRRLPAAQKA